MQKSGVEEQRSDHGPGTPVIWPGTFVQHGHLGCGITAGDARRNGSLRGGRWRGGRKKECLNLTNKAIMLLKTKGRQNEQSQTKPILPVGKQSAVTGNHIERFHSPWVFARIKGPRRIAGWRRPLFYGVCELPQGFAGGEGRRPRFISRPGGHIQHGFQSRTRAPHLMSPHRRLDNAGRPLQTRSSRPS